VVSFDLWDTVFVDDSDEPKRRQQGLPPKPVERRDPVHCFLSRHAPVDRALVNCAYDTADSAFRQVWRYQHFTWSVEVRLRVLLAGLKRELPQNELQELVRLHEEMELRVRPNLVPGVGEALRTLGRRFTLAVVPRSLEESTELFRSSKTARQILGDEFVDHYSTTRDWETRQFRGAVTDWELERYFEMI
jgi:hypothetical protein